MPDTQPMSAEGLEMEQLLMRVAHLGLEPRQLRGSLKLWPRITGTNYVEICQTVHIIREGDAED